MVLRKRVESKSCRVVSMRHDDGIFKYFPKKETDLALDCENMEV
jgi:hypothetical protein